MRMPTRWFPAAFVALSLAAAVTDTPTPAHADSPSSAQRKYQASLVGTVGLNTVVFEAPEGELRVNLPDDAARGDTLSGTVYTSAGGRTPKQRQRNASRLSGYIIEIAGKRSPATERITTFDLPLEPGRDSFGVILRSDKGKRLSEFSVPAQAPQTGSGSGTFEIPEIGQGGDWINVSGPFDGDLTNTIFEVGNVAANPLAESPRKTVFQSPTSVTGLTVIAIAEGGTRIEQEFRNVNVSLGAGKLNLQRGETTNVTVTVAGLSGIENDVPLNLSCTGSADMQNGNVQNIQITPASVGPGGTFSTSRMLIGNNVGNFNVKATVLTGREKLRIDEQPVHVERNPVNIGDENDKVWWLKVKTLDGRIEDIYIEQDFKPNLKFCDWIDIDKYRKEDSTGWTYVTSYQKTDDPTAPCKLKDKTLKVDGDPVGPIRGRWQIRLTGPDGETIYVYVRSPKKPSIRKGQWIRIRDCKKLTSNTFAVDGFDVVDDPNKPPPAAAAPAATPTPDPTPRPTPPLPVVKPCREGAKRGIRKVRKTFEVMTEESEIIFKIYPDKDSGSAADNMAAWLNGTKKLRDFLGDNLPQGAGAGGAAAGAVLTYVDLGADIITALGKSRLRNLSVSEVTADLFVTTKKITATCTTYEVCVGGRWVKKREYTETVKDSTYRRSKSIFKGQTGWEKVSVTSRPQSFDPEKADSWGKEYLKKELEKLKKQGEDYRKFKDECK